MLLVRKTLTEILLEVTDEKIHEISSETLSKYRKKGICAIIVNHFYELCFPKIQNLNENCDERKEKLFVIKKTRPRFEARGNLALRTHPTKQEKLLFLY